MKAWEIHSIPLSFSVPPFLLFNLLSSLSRMDATVGLAVNVVERNDLGQQIEQEKRRNGGEGMENLQHSTVFLRSSVPLVQSGCLR